LHAPHLKWVDLTKLMKRQISLNSEQIADIFYFSAYAYWWPDRKSRHEEYVRALDSSGVKVVLGHFKKKDGSCKSCGARWDAHEEKETDVNIALCILNEAYKDTYDRAHVVSRDSDLKPAVAMVRAQFPQKEVIVVAPPNLGHSTDLIQIAHGKRKISAAQIEQSLFPEFVIDAGGNVIAKRPAQYDPPL
jgi:uncharacterized LabA/DUF88 family protein